MQKLVLYSAFSLLLFVACNKDKFQDTPSITIKSISPTQVPLQSTMEIEMEFTDKQGDLDSVFLIKNRLNLKVKPLNNSNSLSYKLPTFPEKSKGTIKVTLRYNEDLIAAVSPNTQVGAPNNKEPDTLIFKIVVKDKGGNKSDTAITDKLVIERF